MSTTLNHVSLLTPSARPQDLRGARIASSLFAIAVSAIASLFKSPPPRKYTRAEEAEDVRQLAYRVRHSDPGFSADLYAAAARHEQVILD